MLSPRLRTGRDFSVAIKGGEGMAVCERLVWGGSSMRWD